jgi:hypothetical protein
MAKVMIREIPVETIEKLAAPSEKAGLSFDDVISFLRAGFAVEQLLEAIESLIKHETPHAELCRQLPALARLRGRKTAAIPFVLCYGVHYYP